MAEENEVKKVENVKHGVTLEKVFILEKVEEKLTDDVVKKVAENLHIESC